MKYVFRSYVKALPIVGASRHAGTTFMESALYDCIQTSEGVVLAWKSSKLSELGPVNREKQRKLQTL